MLKYTNTTVFNVNVQTIVNTVNCVGAMGAGLALEFKLRFPEMYKDYVARCQRNEVQIGRPYLFREYETFWILNFPTKQHWRQPSEIQWIEDGLKYFSANYKRGGITSVAFPQLGSSLGGLNWEEVKSLMESYLKDLDIDIYLCLDKDPCATGVEGAMVEMVNSMDAHQWKDELGMNAVVLENIRRILPLQRFYELSKLKGIGKNGYDKIFTYFYAKAQPLNSTFLPQSKVEAFQLELISK